MQSVVVQNGVGLGTVIAVVVSWHRNRSLLWAIFHGVCSWLYVIYFALTDRPEDGTVRTGRSSVIVVYVVVVLLAFLAFIATAQFFKL